MSNGISKELQQIQANRYGVDIRVPIHDALAKLSNENYEEITSGSEGFPINEPPESIDTYLQIIEDSIKGSDVKQAIHDALLELSIELEETKTIIPGLAPIAVQLRPDVVATGDNYYVDLTDEENPIEALSDALQNSGLFSMVSYEEEISSFSRSVFIWGAEQDPENDDPLFELMSTGDGEQWKSETVWITSGGTTVQYNPDDLTGEYEQTNRNVHILQPWSVYVVKGKRVLIRCKRDSIVLSLTDSNKTCVALGMGDRNFDQSGSLVIEPYNNIRAFTSDGEPYDHADCGFSQARYGYNGRIVLSSFVCEGSDSYPYGTFITATLPSMSGMFTVGSKTFYTAGCFAIET